MREFFDSPTRAWAAVAVIAGIVLYIVLDLVEDPDSTLLDVVLNLLEVTPVVLTTVGIAVLFQIVRRQSAWRSRSKAYCDLYPDIG